MVKRKHDFYGNCSKSGVTEIDLRSEFGNTVNGKCPEISKFRPGLIRRFRRDADDNRIQCSCVSPVTGEPDRERRCITCLGEGYTWDETPVTFYNAEVNTESQRSDRESLRKPGVMNTPLKAFWLQSKENLTKDDKLVVLVLDKEGKLVLPQKRQELYTISTLLELRLDNGRLEFLKVNGYEDNNKHL